MTEGEREPGPERSGDLAVGLSAAYLILLASAAVATRFVDVPLLSRDSEPALWIAGGLAGLAVIVLARAVARRRAPGD